MTSKALFSVKQRTVWRIWIAESVIRGTDDRAGTVPVQRRSDEAYFKEIA